MPIFTKDNKYFLFIHVPKTGGTSMETLFYRSGWRITFMDIGKEGTLNHLYRCPPQHLHGEALQSQFVLNNFDGIFMVVRNPYDRFCSEYCWATRNQYNCNDSAAVEAWATKVFTAYDDNHFILENHIRPQSEFHLPNATTYKLEQGFTKISKDLGSRYGIKLINEDVRKYTRDSLPGFSSGEVELSKTVKEMINTRYAEDFQLYGYDMEH